LVIRKVVKCISAHFKIASNMNKLAACLLSALRAAVLRLAVCWLQQRSIEFSTFSYPAASAVRLCGAQMVRA
jgi:hypothetical protein